MSKKPFWRNLLLKHPILLVAGVMSLGLAALGVLFVQAELLEQRHFDNFSEKQLAALMANQQQTLTRNTRDYAIWDDIAEQLAGEHPDPKWLRSNFTESIYRNLGVGEVLILGASLQPVYYLHDGQAAPLASLESWSPNLDALLRGRSFQSVLAYSYTGFLWRGDACYLVAVERIRPEHAQAARQRQAAGWLIFALRLDVSWKDQVSTLLSIDGLAITQERIPSDLPSQPLPSLYVSGSRQAETPAAWLRWRVAHAADVTLRRLLGPSFWLGLGVFMTGLLLLVRALLRRQQNELARQERLLRQSELLRQLALRPLLHHEDETPFLNEIVQATAAALRLERISLWLWNGTRWECRAQTCEEDLAHPLQDEGDDWLVRLQEKKIWRIDLLSNMDDDWRNYLLRHGQHTLLAASLPVSGKSAGVLLLESPQHRPWDVEVEHFAASAAELAASVHEAGCRAHNHAASLQHRFYDVLTGLSSRERLVSEVTGMLAANRELLFALISFDDLLQINDEFSYAAGDLALQTLAQRLQSAGGLAARLSADRFVLILPVKAGQAWPLVEMDAVMTHLLAPIRFGKLDIEPAVVCGVSLAPLDARHFEELLQHAEFALETARLRAVKAVEYYAPEINAGEQRRQRLLHELPDALTRGELIVHYQAVIGLDHGQIVGAEASLFWLHPEFGLLVAGEWLAQINRLDRLWMLEQSIRCLVQWRQSSDLWVEVPVGAELLASEALVHDVSVLLARQALPADSLNLAITEAELPALGEAAWGAITGLRALGVGIVLVLGDGKVLLKDLQQLQPMRIRIRADKLGDDRFPRLSEGGRWQADGLLLLETVCAARDRGCRYGQGAYFCRSLSHDEFRLLLAHWVSPLADQDDRLALP